MKNPGVGIEAFDWRLVRSFLAVLDAGSLMGAARTLQARQPTLSRHVAELESQLGAPLFERTGRGVLPTAMALAIADAARQMEAGARSLSQALAGRREVRTGTVKITTSMVAATYLLPPLLTRLHIEEPGIQLELVASNQISNLLRREADIAVRMVRPTQGSLVARKLGSVGIGAYAHER
jgi:DNA-binding transcriptional LysR family regulator